MKANIYLHIIVLFACNQNYAQVQKNILPRYFFQQDFISKNFISPQLKQKPLIIESIRNVDSLFQTIEQSWEKYVKDSLSTLEINLSTQVLNNLDAYSYMWAVFGLSQKLQLPQEVEKHLFSNYMLPSLIKDYETIQLNPSEAHLKLIWAGSLGNTLSFGTKYTFDTKTLHSFYNLFDDLQKLFELFSSADDIEIKKYSDNLLRSLDYYKYEIQAKKFFLAKQPDISFAYFITGLSAGKYPLLEAVVFGKTLIDYFQNTNSKDKCYAILNNLMFSTTNNLLSRDTLYNWYTAIDSSQGKKLYNNSVQKLSGKQFKIVESSKIILPDKWDLLNNSSRESKIKDASFILIDFWYSSCVPCLAEIPALNKLNGKLKDRTDIVFLSINTDFFTTKQDDKFVKEAIKKFNIEFLVVSDTKLTAFNKQFKVNGYPSKFIINNKGELVSLINDLPMSIDTFYDFIDEND